jgi:hypothetical protein
MTKYLTIGFYDKDDNIWWVKRSDIEGLPFLELLKGFRAQFN